MQKPNPSQENQLDVDSQDLQKFGYVQELFRDMGGFSNFAISFSVISILTGITQFSGYGLNHGGPLQMSLGWIVVSIFTFTVALAMAELASAYPTAGALYHWSHFLGGRTLGWFTACFNTIGQFAVLAGIDYGLTIFLVGVLKLPDTMPIKIGIYASLLFSHAVLNHIGIKVVSWLNDFSAGYHIVVVLIIFISLASKGFVQSPSFLFQFHAADLSSSKFYSFLIGILLAQWTLTGYDASAHTAEETVDPRRKAPWGIFMAVVVSVIFGLLMLVAVTLSIPDLAQISATGDAAFGEIFKSRLGEGMGTIVLLLVAGAMWLCGLASLTSASRMIYAFARDGGLPFSQLWAKVHPKFRVPVNAIWGITAFALTLAVSVEIYSAVVSIATISLYISYVLPIAARVFLRFRHKGKDSVGPWNLGKLSTINAIIAVIWVSIICVVFVLPPNDQAGKVMLGCIGFLVLNWIIVRNKFKGPKVNFVD